MEPMNERTILLTREWFGDPHNCKLGWAGVSEDQNMVMMMFRENTPPRNVIYALSITVTGDPINTTEQNRVHRGWFFANGIVGEHFRNEVSEYFRNKYNVELDWSGDN